ncbi:ATP-binding cassette domain-containing protein [Gordonia pseudamarae]|nr:ATP-binding cassette domain-containing protein [Gordonia pseudamarae]
MLTVASVVAIIAAGLRLAPYVAVYAVTTTLFGDDTGPGAGSGTDESGAIASIAMWVAIAIIVRAVAAAVSSHLAHVAAYQALFDLRVALVGKLRRMPLGAVQRRPAGEVKKILGDDVEQLEEALAHGIPDAAAAVAVPLTTTILLFVVDWRLALVALAALVLVVVVSGIGMGLAQKSNVEFMAVIARMNVSVLGFLQGIKVIRGYLRPEAGYFQARDDIEACVTEQFKVAKGPLLWVVSAMSALAGLAVAMLIPITGTGLVNGWVDLGTATLFLLIALAYLSPLMGLVGVLATIITRIQFSGQAIGELLAEPELRQPGTPRRPHASGPPAVTFIDAGFTYARTVGDHGEPDTGGPGTDGQETVPDPPAPVLDGFDLTVPAGTSIAIVGATGSGKSTIGRLIARFWDVDTGSVRVGDVDVRDYCAADLAETVAFVQQDEYIFAGTLFDNIRVARRGATDDEVHAAARAAQLDDVAAGLPDGRRTELPADGGLSGGQRQRVSIARALLKNAPVIILDEATAALDRDTEERTLAAIASLTAGRTTIAIAHRLSTILAADEIIHLDAGRIVARGKHEDLLATDAGYRDLWRDYEAADGWALAADTEPAIPVTGPAPDSVAVPAGKTHDEWSRAALDMVRPGLGDMGFAGQWRTMLGRNWADLVRQGVPRLVCESLVRGIPILAVYLFVRAAVDHVDGSGEMTTGLVWSLFGLVLTGMVARLLAANWVNKTVFGIAARGKADLQLSILEHLRRIPLGYFDRADPSRTASTITNDATMVDFQNVPQLVVASTLQPAYMAVVLLAVDWRLGLCALAGVPLFLGATAISDRIYRDAFAEVHTARAGAALTLLEQARGAAVVRANPGSMFAERYRDAVDTVRSASIAMSVRALPASALGAISVELGLVLIIAVGASLFSAGSVSASVLLVFLMLALVMYQPIQELNELAGYRRNQQQIARKIAEIWDEPALPEPATPAPLTDRASVTFDRVGFSYHGDRAAQVLTDVSFTVPAGTITALVGPSGAGKSTVANLVGRLWDVTDGRVLVGGTDVRELGSEQVTGLVTTVYQDSYLFAESVRFNLRIGRPAATDEQIWAALAAAQCDDVVRALAGGLDERLDEGGTNLSGGQRQRLCIARALLKDSPIVLLDEAVASVDPTTEARIQRALATLMAGRTIIVIAHRMNTVRNVDQIVALDGGRVVAAGSPAEVLSGSYGLPVTEKYT